MARFWLLLAAGLLGLALSEANAAVPSLRGDADDPAAVLSLDDADLVSILQKGKTEKKHYTVDKRVRSLTSGTHHVGTTPNGRHINAHVNKNKKVTGVSLTRKTKSTTVRHGKVFKAKRHPTAARRLPTKKTALAPRFEDETVHVASRQGFAIIGFQIIWISSGIQMIRIIWMPIVVVAPPVIDMAVEAGECGDDAEVRSSDSPGPLQLLSARQGDVAILPSRRARG